MADAAISFLLQQLTDIIVGYKELIAGAKTEFRLLKDELDQLKEHLTGEISKITKQQIRELVYEVEDTIDTWLTEAALAKDKNSFICQQLNRVSAAQQIKSLRQLKVKPVLDRVAGTNSGVKPTANGSDTSMEEPRTKMNKDLLTRHDKVVDLEDEKQTIIDYLREPKKNLEVISIIGMPGLGKTTFAWKIYQNQHIIDEFSTRIWVHVSQRFNPRDVFVSILEQSISKDMPSLSHKELSDQKLIEMVCASLQKEKFLLILDDVWGTDDWKTIQSVMPYKNGMGKVILTSRHKNVGMSASGYRRTQFLRRLNLKESWKLLQLEVFEDLDSCPPQLKDIGEVIAEKCDGVPLVISVIGGILAELFVRTESVIALENEWIEVSKNVDRILEDDTQMLISNVVALSYHRLSDELKDCFLYLGVFPESHEIPTWTLTRFWIAEGFVQHKKGKTVEESAEDNLYELINRNLVMVGRKTLDQVKTCRVHDMIRAFCRSEAMKKNFFRVMKRTNEGLFEPHVSEVENYHRLSLHSDPNKFLSEVPDGSSIRSFLYFYMGVIHMEGKHIDVIPHAFKLLRVLESRSIRIHEFPESLTTLIHLRYIALCIHDLKCIPEHISRLWNLQTILVNTNSSSVTMKANLWKMVRLRHLKTKAAIVLDKNWKGRAGENLQTLDRLSPESWTTALSKRVSTLKTLGIFGDLATLVDKTSFEMLSNLQSLKLVNHLLLKSPSENPLLDLPRFPPHLKRLTLSNTFLDWEHMSTLAMIKSLQVIKLKQNAFTGPFWNVGGTFHSLQLLLIVNSNLVKWEVSEHYFPSLRCLVLKNCDKLQQIPGNLAKNLEKLEIHHLRRQSAIESAKKIELEKRKEEDQGIKWAVPFKLIIVQD